MKKKVYICDRITKTILLWILTFFCQRCSSYDNSFAQRCKRQIEYEKTLAPGSEELRKAREDFKKAYLEERESVRVKMCEGRAIRIKAIEKSPEYYAGQEQYNHYFDLFFSMEEDYVNYTECRP